MKSLLLAELKGIAGVEDRDSLVAGGTALFYRGKEFAHFHNGNELDLRLTKKVIQQLKLSHPKRSVHHPDRSGNSPWIEVRFFSAADVEMVVDLVRIAVKPV